MHYSVKKWGRQRVQSLGESPKSPLWSTRTMQARGRGRPGGVTGAPGPMTSAPRWGVYPIFFLIEQLFEGTDLVRFQFQKEHFGSRMTMLIRGGYTVTERANPISNWKICSAGEGAEKKKSKSRSMKNFNRDSWKF